MYEGPPSQTDIGNPTKTPRREREVKGVIKREYRAYVIIGNTVTQNSAN